MKNITPSKIVNIATANPRKAITQQQTLDFLMNHKELSHREKKFYQLFMEDHGIETRHFAVDSLEELLGEKPQDSIERFELEAVRVGAEAIRKCLNQLEITPREVDGLIVTTCTGYLCPGLSSYLSEVMGFTQHIETYDLAGLGCGAAIPAIRTADQFLASHPDSNVLVVCIEISSAALYWGEEIDLILSNAIFADGAAACLVSNKENLMGFQVSGFQNILWPEYRDDLRFKHREGRLCNVIKKEVPQIAGKAVEQLFGQINSENKEVKHHFAIHPGGRKILDEIQGRLCLTDQQMSYSRSILKKYGNMSSPSVLFVLNEIMKFGEIEEGDLIHLFAFGAGFSAFGATLEVNHFKPVERKKR